MHSEFTPTPECSVHKRGNEWAKKRSVSTQCPGRKPVVWGFAKRVYAVVAKIPRGKVLTYQEVAKRAGRPKAYRAVGNILSQNRNPKVPCHRVIRSDGQPGGYSGLRGKSKVDILRREGVKI